MHPPFVYYKSKTVKFINRQKIKVKVKMTTIATTNQPSNQSKLTNKANEVKEDNKYICLANTIIHTYMQLLMTAYGVWLTFNKVRFPSRIFLFFFTEKLILPWSAWPSWVRILFWIWIPRVLLFVLTIVQWIRYNKKSVACFKSYKIRRVLLSFCRWNTFYKMKPKAQRSLELHRCRIWSVNWRHHVKLWC